MISKTFAAPQTMAFDVVTDGMPRQLFFVITISCDRHEHAI